MNEAGYTLFITVTLLLVPAILYALLATIARCKHCGRFVAPHLRVCPHCFGAARVINRPKSGWIWMSPPLILVVFCLVVVFRASKPKLPPVPSAAFVGPAAATKTATPPPSIPEPARPLTTEEIASRSDHAVAVVRGRVGTGTGFLVGPGLLATNAHVIFRERIEDLGVTFPATHNRVLKTELLFEDVPRDLALLAVPTDLAPLEIEPAYQFRRGQDVTVIGNPGVGNKVVLENAVSRGVMSTTAVLDGQNFYQLSISINPGNSGGPVIDSSGKVIGVATGRAIRQEAIAFCIPSEDIVSAIAQADRGNQGATAVSLMHRARYIAIRLNMIGTFCGETLNAAVRGIDESLILRTNPNINLGQVQQAAAPTLKEIDATLTNDLYAEMNRVADDQRIAQSVRDDLVNAWSVCVIMKRSIDSPTGTTDTYKAEASMLKDHYGRVIKRLLVDLNLPQNP